MGKTLTLSVYLAGFIALPLLAPTSAWARDDVVEINGAVQAMPASGLIGNWTIAGRSARSDASTVIKQEIGPISVGALVEAKATPDSTASLLLTRIEVKQSAPGSVPTGGPGVEDFTGVVELAPAGGAIGSWRIAGRTVVVASTTVLDQEHGVLAVGATVEVHATLDGAGALIAARIEVRAGASAVTTPAQIVVELSGAVNALPAAGLLGIWRIGDRSVVVNASTALNSEHGTFVLGSSVEVHGTVDASGGLTATRIERIAGNGAPTPALKFWGTIQTLPTSQGSFGLWRVDDRMVNVSPSTIIRLDHGPIRVGAIVEVDGWAQSDAVIEAHEIETRTAVGELENQGSEAIEFFNARLGHFFMSAFPSEIASLDAGSFGGEWHRTGEHFKVGGGTTAVCRFYGAPPKGPDSHFFTADAEECRKVMETYPAWTFEAHAFSITASVNGACPVDTIAVHRLYNNPVRGAEMNHRYTVTDAALHETMTRGWLHEGVVMCAHR